MLTKFNLYIGLNDKAYKISGTLDIVPVINSIKAVLNQESIAVIREQVDSRLL